MNTVRFITLQLNAKNDTKILNQRVTIFKSAEAVPCSFQKTQFWF